MLGYTLYLETGSFGAGGFVSELDELSKSF